MKRRLRGRGINWRSVHRWAGLIMVFFMLMFCISGLIMNHRGLVNGCDVSRSLLPSDYRIHNYNNGVAMGTVALPDDSVLLYGNVGVFKGDRRLNSLRDFNAGLPPGVDNRNVRNIVRTRSGVLYCAARSGLYRHDGRRWTPVGLPDHTGQVSDVTLMPDSTGVIALTRSDVYVGSTPPAFRKVRLQALPGQEPEVTLFKSVWNLHSGQLFGLPGVLVVDAIALVIIFLCLTGIVIFVMPYSIRRSAAAKVIGKARLLKWNFRWHNRMGYWTIALTLLIAATGVCLRPPLMVPLVLCKTSPLPGSTLDSDNPWHDRLRAIRWDSASSRWLLSTSEGFYTLDRDFREAPRGFAETGVPPVSPMGVNVFEETAPGKWLIGSFTGLFVWNPDTGEVRDRFTGKPHRKKMGPPISDHLVAGYTADLDPSAPVIFDYAYGATTLPTRMGQRAAVKNLGSPQIEDQPIALWNVAQEIHTGRIYDTLTGPLSPLFIFIAGLAALAVLISGLVRYRHHA